MRNILANWKKVKALSVFKIQGGAAFKSEDATTEGIRWLKIANVGFNRIKWNEISYLPEHYVSDYENVCLKEKDIVVAMTRPLLQNRLKIAQLHEIDAPCLLNQRVGRILPNDMIDKEFLYQLLRTKRIAYKLESDLLGTDPPNLSIKTFKNISIFLPPLPEQRTIANILSTWDEAIKKMEKLIEAKERRFGGLLKEVIEDPNNKEINTRLGKICIVKKGQQLNKAHMEEGGEYYALNGGVEPSGRTCDWNTEANTITISEGGNSCGFVSLNRERFWSGGHCYSLANLDDNINVDYLFYYLKYFQPQIMRLRVGSGLPNIQKKDIDKFQLNLPKLEKQTSNALKLKLANNEIELLNEVLNKYKEQKLGLMQKLLTGEWRVKV